MDRREFLLAGAAAAAGRPAQAAPKPGKFTFVHFTDTHIEPELRATEGVGLAVSKINKVRPEFAIAGGDLVFDANDVAKPRAQQVFDLYQNAAKRLEMPVHTVIGNHDVFGLSNKSGVEPSDPHYGKKMFEERIGKRYQSFDHKGWHFILLDSIGIAPDRQFRAHVDAEQIDWLKADLAKTGQETPVIVVTHVPLVTAVSMTIPGWTFPGITVENAVEVTQLFWPYKVKAVFQGHTHVCENVTYKGTQFITTGAVSGNWWKGAHQGFREGFGVVTVNGDNLSYRYETTGFVADPAKA